MSMLLWFGDGDNDAIDVGSVLHVFPAFKQVSKLIAGAEGFDELQSVPGFAEQRVTNWWLSQVASQGDLFLSQHGNDMGELKWVVEDLVSAIRKLGNSGMKTPQVEKSRLQR